MIVIPTGRNYFIFDIGCRSDTLFTDFNSFGIGNENADSPYYPRHQSFYDRIISCKVSDEANKIILKIKKGIDYIKEKDIQVIDFIKIYTEGYELNIFGLKNYEFIVRKEHPKIISNPILPRHMDIKELYTYFKVSNSEALLTIVKSFPASLEQRFIQDIPKLKLIPSIYLYIKEKDLFKNIDYKDLLIPPQRTEQTIDYSMMFLDFDESAEPDDTADLKFYSYAIQSSDEYKARLSIFYHLNIDWNAELVNYLKKHQLYEFLYTRILASINNRN